MSEDIKGTDECRKILGIFPQLDGEIKRNFHLGEFVNLNIDMATDMTPEQVIDKFPNLCGSITEKFEEGNTIKTTVKFSTKPR